MRVLAIGGSLRRDSLNAAIARALPRLAPAGVEVDVYERLGAVPAYDADADATGEPAAVADLRRAVREADAVLFATPEYNGSVPGVLKNAVDWLSRPRGAAALTGKTATVVGASTGQYGALWAQSDLRRILGIAGARVIGDELPIARAGERFAGGTVDEETARRLTGRLEALFEAERGQLAA